MLPGSTIEVDMIYGTAWKGENTSQLVSMALEAGFRAFDTAAQPKHYREDLVAKALHEAINAGKVTRNEIQTKFTPTFGQDPDDCPYDLNADLASQVGQSVSASLGQFSSKKEDYIDCLILHGVLPDLVSTIIVWEAMSSFVPSRVRCLGISNTTLPVLRTLNSIARVKPSIVQNRFSCKNDWDGSVRRYCQDSGLCYEGFWVLKANQGLLQSQLVGEVVSEFGVTPEIGFYALVRGLSIHILNGTSRAEQMQRDICGMRKINFWKQEHENIEKWQTWIMSFAKLTNTNC